MSDQSVSAGVQGQPSVAPQGQPVPNSAQPGAAPAQAAPQTPPSLLDNYTGIPAQYQQDEAFKDFKSIDDVFNEFKTMRAVQTNRETNGLWEGIGENSTPEQVSQFYERLGKPKSPAEYELSRPEDLPQGMDYSDELAASFAQFAHENHLTKAQTQSLYSFYHNMAKDSYTSYVAQQESAIEQNFVQLESVWGKQGTPQFDQQHKAALRAFNHVADPEMAAAFKADPQLASNPLVLQLLSRLGSKMSSDVVPTVGGTTSVAAFGTDLQSIDKNISDFHKTGNFKEMMNPANPNQKQLKQSWDALWAEKRRLMASGQ